MNKYVWLLLITVNVCGALDARVLKVCNPYKTNLHMEIYHNSALFVSKNTIKSGESKEVIVSDGEYELRFMLDSDPSDIQSSTRSLSDSTNFTLTIPAGVYDITVGCKLPEGVWQTYGAPSSHN
jgi:hypothetical protein